MIMAAASLVLGSSAPAAAQEADWRVSVTGRADALGGFQEVGASGSKDAWVVRTGLPLLRWNGSSWRPASGTAVPYLVSSFSPGELWRFHESTERVDVVRWNGKEWSRLPIAAEGAHATAAVVPGRGECWAAGIQFGAHGMSDVVWHWQGRGWHTVEAPLPISDFAAASRKDVWALSSPGESNLGYDGERAASIMRWSGGSWRRESLPIVTQRSRLGDAYAELSDILAISRDEVYAVGAITTLEGGERVVKEGIVLRWNGHAWRRLPHRPLSTGYKRVASDGAGGLWLATERQGRSDVLTHFTGPGKWAQVTLDPPAGATRMEVKGVANVPGTTRMWATVEASGPGKTRQLVLSHQ